MATPTDTDLLDVILDSWDRNNRILVNLLRAIPDGDLQARVMPSSPSVAQMFAHMHYVRAVFLAEDAPEFAIEVPTREWQLNENNADHLAEALHRSAEAVRDAVRSLVISGGSMKLHYDHPLLYLQHMIWHEGYHHGQIKLALKVAGHPFEDKKIGPLTWSILIRKTKGAEL